MESSNMSYRVTGLEVGRQVRIIVSDRVMTRAIDIGTVGLPLPMLWLVSRAMEQNGLFLEARVLQPV